jgi:hypothetical protein
MNVAKVALILIFLLLLIIVFFALTGLDVRNPMPAIERILAWTIELNRSVSRAIQNFFASVRISIREALR